MRAGVLALCLAALSCVAANDFIQCGGTTNCNGRTCTDAPWPGVSCARGFVCGRQNVFFWQCTNDPKAVTAAPGAGAPAAAAAAPAPAPAAPRRMGNSAFLLPGLKAGAPAPTPAPAPAAAPGPAPAPAAPRPMGNSAFLLPGLKAGAKAPAPPPAAAAGARPPVAYPVMKPSGTRSSGLAARACACLDVGLNDGACFEGITKYCTSDRPDMKVCESMSLFFNQQDVAAGAVVAKFLLSTCALSVPSNASPCACVDGAETAGCKAAAMRACSLSQAICPALAFGSEASAGAQEAYGRLIDAECGGSASAARVAMNFTDVTVAQFKDKYAKGVVAALSQITQLRAGAISAAAEPVEIKVGSLRGAGARRRLMQSNRQVTTKVITDYVIRSNPKDAAMVLQRLQDAGANGAEGLYAVLAANGVPLKPTFSVEGGPAVGAAKPRGALGGGAIAGIVVGCVAGAALLAGAVALLALKRRGKGKPTCAATASVTAPGKPEGAKAAAGAEGAKAQPDAGAEAPSVVVAEGAAAEEAAHAPSAAAAAAAAGASKDAAAAGNARAVGEAAEAPAAAAAALDAGAAAAAPAQPKRKPLFSLTASGWQTNPGA